MAFNYNPSGYFPGIVPYATVNGEPGVFIPYSDLESYDYDIAVNHSGDIRQLVYSFNQAVADEYLSLNTADRFANMVISRTAAVPVDSVLRRIYTTTCNLDIGAVDVKDE